MISLRERALRVIEPYRTDAARTAAGTLGWLLVLYPLSQLAAAGSLVVLTFGLSAGHFGLVAFGLALQSYLLIVANFGTHWIAIREGVARPSRLDRTATALLVVTVSSAALTGLGLLLGAWVSPVARPERLLLVFIGIGVMTAGLDVRTLFDVHHRQRASAWIVFVAETMTLASFGVLAIQDWLTLPTAGAVLGGRIALVSIGHLVFYHLFIRPLRWRFGIDDGRRMVSHSWPMLLATLLALAPFTAGIFFLRRTGSDTDLALFGLAQQIGIAHLMLGVVAGRVLRPHIFGGYGRHPEFLKHLRRFTVGFSAVLLLVGLAGAWILIDWFLEPFYGAAFRATIAMVTASTLNLTGSLAATYLTGVHRQSKVLTVDAIVAGVYCLGAWFGAPLFGYLWLAGLTLLVVAFRTVMMTWLAARTAAAQERGGDPC